MSFTPPITALISDGKLWTLHRSFALQYCASWCNLNETQITTKLTQILSSI